MSVLDVPDLKGEKILQEKILKLKDQRIIQESALCANKHMNKVIKGELELELC